MIYQIKQGRMIQSGSRGSRRQLSFPSQVCKLCGGKHSHTSSPQQWTNERACELVKSLGVSPDSLVCRPCRQDVTRVLGSSSYIPRWEKSRENECCIHKCTEHAIAYSSMASQESMKAAFEAGDLKCMGDEIPFPTPLCKCHYHVVYNLLQPTQTNCPTCGACLKYTHSRPCPNPHSIETYLKEITGFEGKIKPDERVCYTCYKSHLAILQQEKSVSKDSDLLLVINTLKQTSTSVNDISSMGDVLTFHPTRGATLLVLSMGMSLILHGSSLATTLHSQIQHLPAMQMRPTHGYGCM